MQQARAELRGGMHAFSEDVLQDVVTGLRELCVAVIIDVYDRVVAAEGRVQREGPGSDVPDGSSGKVGIEVVAGVADEVAGEGEVGVEVFAEVLYEVSNEGEVRVEVVAEVSDGVTD